MSSYGGHTNPAYNVPHNSPAKVETPTQVQCPSNSPAKGNTLTQATVPPAAVRLRRTLYPRLQFTPPPNNAADVGTLSQTTDSLQLPN